MMKLTKTETDFMQIFRKDTKGQRMRYVGFF